MEYIHQKPHPVLRPFFEEYFAITNDESLESPLLIIPDGTHGILFVENSHIKRIGSIHKNDYSKLNASYVFGQKTHPVYYEFGNSKLFLFGIKLKPTGLSSLLSIDSSELTNQFTYARDYLGLNFRELESQLYGEAKIQNKFRLLDTYFLKMLNKKNRPKSGKVDFIIQFINARKGDLKVKEISQKFGIGYKTLDRLFKKEIGIGPKNYCRIVRFNSSLYYYEKESYNSLTRLAYTTGYFDQNHFIKEVKTFSNLTPTSFYKSIDYGILGQQHRMLIDRFKTMS